jgi:hypothetical protein
MVDEVEEWRMLAQHYCVAFAWRDGGPASYTGDGVGGQEVTADAIFAGWCGVRASSVEMGNSKPSEAAKR